jgi:phasin family protein
MAAKKDAEPMAKLAAPVEHVAQATATAMKDGIGQTVAAMQDSMTGVVAGFEKTQQEIQVNMEKAFKSAEEFISFGQGNFEAVMKSGQIWATGVQEFGKTFASLAQTQMDQAMATFKAMSGVKSLKEAIDLQTTLARTSVEAAMNETGKLTDASIKLAEQASAPITARVTMAVEKFGRAA